MDPYVSVGLNGREIQQTEPHQNGGKSPRWDKEMAPIAAPSNPAESDMIEFKIYDQGTCKSHLLGECRIALSGLVHGQVIEDWYTVGPHPFFNPAHLVEGHKPTGRIQLRLQFQNAELLSLAKCRDVLAQCGRALFETAVNSANSSNTTGGSDMDSIASPHTNEGSCEADLAEIEVIHVMSEDLAETIEVSTGLV
jgi:hypothetical protein